LNNVADSVRQAVEVIAGGLAGEKNHRDPKAALSNLHRDEVLATFVHLRLSSIADRRLLNIMASHGRNGAPSKVNLASDFFCRRNAE
jgi:hypothetical protein